MDNKEIWDKNWKNLGNYALYSAGSRWAFYLIKKICKKADINPNALIIDCGCGVGAKTSLLAHIFPNNNIFGVDFSSQGIDFAKKFFTDISNLDFKCIDVHQLVNELHESVEMISAFELIEHIEDWETFLGDICRTSQKYVLLSTQAGRMREYEKQVGHYRNYSKGEIEKFMKKNGYDTVEVFYAGFPLWSPITRDILNYVNTTKKRDSSNSELQVSFNPLLHKIVYFMYRFFTFNKIGDQFVGLFIKTGK